MDPRTAPAYSGIATFLRAPLATVEELRKGDIGIVGAPFDTTCGSRPGARLGPRGIREGSLHFMYQLGALMTERKEMVDIYTGERFRYPPRDVIRDLGDVPVYPSSVEKTTEEIAAAIRSVTRQGAFPLTLGGDHYISYPAATGFVEGLRERSVSGRIGYIHIDSHLDLTDDTEPWGKLYHGSIARRVSELEGFDGKRMAWVGIGGSFQAAERWDYAREIGASVFTTRHIEDAGLTEVVRRAVEVASRDTETIYLTVDIDVVDHAFAPGTGSYVFGGISSTQFLHMMDLLGKAPIGGMDLVEVAPPLDPTGCTSRLAAMGLIAFLRRRIFDIR